MSLFMLMMAVSGVIGTGAASCISRCLGESNGERASKALSSGTIICLCLGLLSALLGSLFIEPIVKALGANSETFPFAQDYSIVLLLGAAFIMCNFALSQLIRSEGSVVVSMMGIASKLMTAGTFIFMGFSVGCQPLIGYNFGAKNNVRVKNIIKTGMLITSMIGIVLMVVFIFFAKECISVFTPIEDVAKSGAFILRGLAWSLPVYGAQMVGAVTVQAMGKGKASLLISVARQGIFYIPILFLLNSAFGLNGLIFAQPLTDLLAFVVTLGILKYIYSVRQTEGSEPCLTE